GSGHPARSRGSLSVHRKTREAARTANGPALRAREKSNSTDRCGLSRPASSVACVAGALRTPRGVRARRNPKRRAVVFVVRGAAPSARRTIFLVRVACGGGKRDADVRV